MDQLLKETLLEKLTQNQYCNLKNSPEELCNYVLLNIERKFTFNEMLQTLELFMGELAESFCIWLRDNVNVFNEQKVSSDQIEDGKPQRRINHCWDEYSSDNGDNSNKHIQSVVKLTRSNNRRRNHNYERGAAHMFLRAVGEANNGSRYDCDGEYKPVRPKRNLRPNDLRHKINANKNNRNKETNDHRYNYANARSEKNRSNDVTDTLASKMESTSIVENRKRPINTSQPNAPNPIRKKKIRCKFWPSCKRGDSCEYVHPSEKCKHLPNCPYGETCLYIHPQEEKPKPPPPKVTEQICRYDAICMMPGCQRLHPNRTKFTCKRAYTWVNPSLSKMKLVNVPVSQENTTEAS